MRLLQRWTSCWQQRPRSCLDKHHPNCQKHHKHHPTAPGAGMGSHSPSTHPARGQQPQGWAGAAPCPGCCRGCLGVCWREGGALLAVSIQLGTGLDELIPEIKYQEGELETAGGTGGGLPCSLCAPSLPHTLSPLEPGPPTRGTCLSCCKPQHLFLLEIKSK